MTTPVLLAWSGGKDSTLALERLLGDARYHVVGLITTVTSTYERIAIHGVRRSILHRQGVMLRLPLVEAGIPPQASNDIYESAFASALERARQVTSHDVEHIAFGDLFLEDVRHYREAMLTHLRWHGLYPVWGEDTAKFARHFIARGHRAILTCVDTQQLAADFCGRNFDADFLDDLPPSCDPCGENGEFHTCVHDSPLFAKPIPLTRGERVLRDGRFQYIDLVESDRTDPDRGLPDREKSDQEK